MIEPLKSAAPALALLEIESIARGVVVLDALCKKARVELVLSEALTPGKFLLVFCGDEASVEEAFNEARRIASEFLLADLFLPQAHPLLVMMLRGHTQALCLDEALAICEYKHVAAALDALDRALKAATIESKKFRFARGIGGKAYFVLGGTLASIEAAVEAAKTVQAQAHLAHEIIARISPDVCLEHL